MVGLQPTTPRDKLVNSAFGEQLLGPSQIGPIKWSRPKSTQLKWTRSQVKLSYS